MAGTFASHVGSFGDYSFVVLFVEGPFDDVETHYGEIVGLTPVSVDEVTTRGKHFANPVRTVVESNNSRWTTIFHVVGFWQQFDACQMAKQLKSRIVAFEGEDVSGATTCTNIHPNGRSQLLLTKDDYKIDPSYYKRQKAEIIDDYDLYFESQDIVPPRLSFNKTFSKAVVDRDSISDVGRIVRFVENDG